MIRAFFKLKVRDRVILSVAALLAVGLIVAVVFNFLSGSVMTFSLFPNSVLMHDGRLQEYHYRTFGRLDEQVQFPGTDYGISIGGDEFCTTDIATTFKYTEMMKLTAALMDGQAETKDFVKHNMPYLLTADLSAVGKSYSVKEYDTGYLNTFETEYEAGILETSVGKFYIMTYRFTYDGHDFLIGVSTQKRSYINDAFYEMDHMFYTFCYFGGQDDGDVSVVAPSGEVDKISQNNVPYHFTAPTIELIGEPYGNIHEAAAVAERESYKLSYPEADKVVSKLRIDDGLSDDKAAFSFEYTYTTALPSSASLISPSGKQYSPEYMNDDNDGRIMFVVDKPETGVWEIEVSDDVKMGEYVTHAMDYSDYMELVKPAPREVGPMDEDKDYVSVAHTVSGAVVSMNGVY